MDIIIVTSLIVSILSAFDTIITHYQISSCNISNCMILKLSKNTSSSDD